MHTIQCTIHNTLAVYIKYQCSEVHTVQDPSTQVHSDSPCGVDVERCSVLLVALVVGTTSTSGSGSASCW